MKKHSKRLRGAACALSAALALSAVPFSALPAVSAADDAYYLRGDVIENDGVTNKDALAIQKYKLNLSELDENQLLAADANADDQVNMADAVAIMQWVLTGDRTHHVGEYVRISDGKAGTLGKSVSSTDTIYVTGYTAEADGNYKLRLNVKNNTGAESLSSVMVNDEMFQTPFVIPEGESETIVIIELKAGENIIRIESDRAVSISPDSEVFRTSNNPDPKVPVEYIPITSTTTSTTRSTTTTTRPSSTA